MKLRLRVHTPTGLKLELEAGEPSRPFHPAPRVVDVQGEPVASARPGLVKARVEQVVRRVAGAR